MQIPFCEFYCLRSYGYKPAKSSRLPVIKHLFLEEIIDLGRPLLVNIFVPYNCWLYGRPEISPCKCDVVKNLHLFCNTKAVIVTSHKSKVKSVDGLVGQCVWLEKNGKCRTFHALLTCNFLTTIMCDPLTFLF